MDSSTAMSLTSFREAGFSSPIATANNVFLGIHGLGLPQYSGMLHSVGRQEARSPHPHGCLAI